MSEEKLLETIRNVLGDEILRIAFSTQGVDCMHIRAKLSLAAEAMITTQEIEEFSHFDSILRDRKNEFYKSFGECDAEKEYSYLHWHKQRYSGEPRTMFLLGVAEDVASRRSFRAMLDMIKRFANNE